MRNVNIFKIKYIIALFRWYFKVSKYIKPNKTNISLSRRMGSLWYMQVEKTEYCIVYCIAFNHSIMWCSHHLSTNIDPQGFVISK